MPIMFVSILAIPNKNYVLLSQRSKNTTFVGVFAFLEGMEAAHGNL